MCGFYRDGVNHRLLQESAINHDWRVYIWAQNFRLGRSWLNHVKLVYVYIALIRSPQTVTNYVGRVDWQVTGLIPDHVKPTTLRLAFVHLLLDTQYGGGVQRVMFVTVTVIRKYRSRVITSNDLAHVTKKVETTIKTKCCLFCPRYSPEKLSIQSTFSAMRSGIQLVLSCLHTARLPHRQPISLNVLLQFYGYGKQLKL